MYPSILAETCAYSQGGCIQFPALAKGSKAVGSQAITRTVCSGGFFVDTPAGAHVGMPGAVMGCPAAFPAPSKSIVKYDYTATNNRGAPVQCSGHIVVTPSQAELLGWLLSGGSLHSHTQSLRFASSSAGALQRVQKLVTKGFSGVSVKWYAKNAGYDITMTGGINNPLRHFLRSMDFYHGFPLALNKFNQECRLAFLRGLWGADGWAYPRKNGTDVVMGLARTPNEYLFSALRLFHAGVLGMQGTREVGKGTSRLVFNGYKNYEIFQKKIGIIGSNRLSKAPVRRTSPSPALFIANGQEMWYWTRVVKALRLAQPVLCYHLPGHRYG